MPFVLHYDRRSSGEPTHQEDLPVTSWPCLSMICLKEERREREEKEESFLNLKADFPHSDSLAASLPLPVSTEPVCPQRIFLCHSFSIFYQHVSFDFLCFSETALFVFCQVLLSMKFLWKWALVGYHCILPLPSTLRIYDIAHFIPLLLCPSWLLYRPSHECP